MRNFVLQMVLACVGLLWTTMASGKVRYTPEGYNLCLLMDEGADSATVTYQVNEDGSLKSGFYSGEIGVPNYAYMSDKYVKIVGVEDSAFFDSYITQLTIQNCVKKLGKPLFKEADSPTTLRFIYNNDFSQPIEIGYDEESGKHSLSNLVNLQNLYLDLDLDVPEGVKPFADSKSLSYVEIGNRIKSLPGSLLAECTGLKTVKLYAETPPVMDESVFEGVDISQVQLLLPMKSMKAYKADEQWSKFENMREMTAEEQYGFKVYRKFEYLDWVDFSLKNEDGVELFYKINKSEDDFAPYYGVILTGVPALIDGWIYSYPYYQDSINVPASVKDPNTGVIYEVVGLRDFCFENDPYLSKVNLPEGLQHIGMQAFMSLPNLKSIDLPSSVKYFDENAFAESGLEGEFVLPRETRYLGTSMFRNTHITKLTHEEGCKLDSVASQAIFFMFELEEVEFPSSLRVLDMAAVSSCPKLKKADLPEGLETIYPMNFVNCSIEEFVLPSTVKDLEEGVLSSVGASFQHMYNSNNTLCKIAVAEGNPQYDSRDNCNAVIETATNKLLLATAISTLPETLDSIPDNAFVDGKVKTITLPEGLEYIAPDAFVNQMIGMPASFDKVVSKIENPAGVLAEGAFNGCYETATLYVPAGTKSKYQADSEWAKFVNVVEDKPQTVKDITPVSTSKSTVFSGITEETDLSGTVVDNVFVTLNQSDDETSSDTYDTTEKAFVLNSLGDESKIDFIESQLDNADVLMNNFSGLVIDVAAGSGELTVTALTTGNRNLTVKVGGQLAQAFKSAVKGEVKIPYTTDKTCHIYIYSTADPMDEDEEMYKSALVKKSAVSMAKKMNMNGLKGLKTADVALDKDVMVAEDGPETNQTLIYGVGVAPGATAIETVEQEMGSNAAEVEFFSADGRRLNAPVRGVNIVRKSDNSIEKVIK